MITIMHSGGGYKPRIVYSDGRTFVPDWLFVNVPKRRDSLDAIIPDWNISQKYEDVGDIPDDAVIEDMSYPRTHDHPQGPYSVPRGSQDSIAMAKWYGRVKVEGAWVYSTMMKMDDYSYHYFYHYFYTGPKKERPQHLWPHADPESPIPFVEGIQ